MILLKRENSHLFHKTQCILDSANENRHSIIRTFFFASRLFGTKLPFQTLAVNGVPKLESTVSKLVFQANTDPTLGVEIELGLVDSQSMSLSSSIGQVMAAVPSEFEGEIKSELMQCYLEINTKVCQTVSQAESDLSEKILLLEQITRDCNLNLLWGATHPFSRWHDQKVTPDPRYHGLVELLQDMARRLVTFGLHVHIGVDSGDKAIMICDQILEYIPTLLALSCNSPFWCNRKTGLHSIRSKILEGLPTAGLPPVMRNWTEYTWLVNHLIQTGFINTVREIWWDVRPHHQFGTVEVRVCDIPGNLHDTLGLVALVQCLVKTLSDRIDRGTYQSEHHSMMVRQNKWRACRFGVHAQLVDSSTYEVRSVEQITERLITMVMPVARQLDCESFLERVRMLAKGPDWADRQLTTRQNNPNPEALVKWMTLQSKL